MFSENDVILDFIVVVNYMSIFVDTIFMNLHLILLTYYFPIHLMFYWENHITSKYQLFLTIFFCLLVVELIADTDAAKMPIHGSFLSNIGLRDVKSPH